MKVLICPISTEKTDNNVVRYTAFITAVVLALYALTGWAFFILLLLSDYFFRAFSPYRFSVMNWLAAQTVKQLNLPHHPINKAPKLFAVRVGFLFALMASLAVLVSTPVSIGIGLVLMFFNLLDALANICVGCLMYTYVVQPLFGDKQGKTA